MTTLPPFPVDDVTLAAVEHALTARLTVDPDGTHRVVEGDYTLPTLLNFLSGYDPAMVVPLVGDDGHESPDVTEYVGGPLYGVDDLITALINEVRRLRTAGPSRTKPTGGPNAD